MNDDTTSSGRRRAIYVAILAVAGVAALAILRMQPGTDADDADDEAPPAAQAHKESADRPPDLVLLDADSMRAAGIEVVTAGPGQIFRTIELAGTVTADPQRTRKVAARFPGVVQQVAAGVGDHVTAGATLAIVESDDSLQRYAVRAPISGVIAERNASPGEHTGDQPIVTVVDLSEVWVELPLFASDAALLRAGQPASIAAQGGTSRAEAPISFIAPVASNESHTTTARIVLPNGEGRWRPGMAVTVRVRTETIDGAVVVPREAVQRHDGTDVVFVADPKGFRVRQVELGIDDGSRVQVLAGLRAGERVAAANSFVVLAELEKGSLPSDD